jgi:hypothetical protein
LSRHHRDHAGSNAGQADLLLDDLRGFLRTLDYLGTDARAARALATRTTSRR